VGASGGGGKGQGTGAAAPLPHLWHCHGAIDTWSFCFRLMCVFTSEAWHTGVVNSTNPQNFLLLYQIGLKLSVGTVLTNSSLDFSHTIDSDTIRKWGGKGLVLPHCIEIWGGGRPPPCPIACSTPEHGMCIIVNSPLHGTSYCGRLQSVYGRLVLWMLPDRNGEGTRNGGQWPVRRRVSDLVL